MHSEHSGDFVAVNGTCVPPAVCSGDTAQAAHYTGPEVPDGTRLSMIQVTVGSTAAYPYILYRRQHPSDEYELVDLRFHDRTGNVLTAGGVGTDFEAHSRSDTQPATAAFYVADNAALAWMFDGTGGYIDDYYSTWHEVLVKFSAPQFLGGVRIMDLNLQQPTSISLYGSNDGVYFFPLPIASASGTPDTATFSVGPYVIPWGASNTYWLTSEAKVPCEP